jgi:hypothetical protein
VWATVELESPVKLREGRKYYLILRTVREDTEYQTFAIREGASYGYPKTSYFSDGMAQVSDGGPWQAFSAWSGPNPEGDLQFAFR